MRPEIRQQIAAYLKGSHLDLFLTTVRQGADPCPSDLDILNALIALAPLADPAAVRVEAQRFTAQRLERRKVIAARQRRKQVDKLRKLWYEEKHHD